jgi:phosphoglycerate dehydrogenase-like enzyme
MTPAALDVVFLPHPRGLFEPWGRDVLEAVGQRHAIRVYDPEAPVSQLAAADVVIDHGGAAGTREQADAARRVRLWQILGTGFDHFDVEYWRGAGIPVANCPGTLTAGALADHAMLLLLLLARRFAETSARLAQGRFYEPAGTELAGLRLLVVGLGASGRELARRARGFGMEVAAIDVRPLERERAELGLAFAGGPDALEPQLALADVVSLHLHLDAATRHTLDARRLALLRPSAFVLNVSRGELVDEAALVAALTRGHLGGAGLDVFAEEPLPSDSPLLSLPNVVATPHVAGVTLQASRRRAAAAAANVDRIAAGLPPLHRIA